MKGLTIIYWGYGKGKTTAAVGLALRALGQGQRVFFMQFMKGEDWKTGEAQMFESLQAVAPRDQVTTASDLVTSATAQLEFCIVGKGWVRIMEDSKPITEHQGAAWEGLVYAKKQIDQWDVVILDEILSAVDAGLLTVSDIKDLIQTKPASTHLVMTGHKEYPELVEMADVVTKMEKIKHPFDKGVLAQQGVDF